MKLNVTYPKIDFSKLKNKTVLITGASGLIGINMLNSIKSVKDEYNITIHTKTKNSCSMFDDIFSGCNNTIVDESYDEGEEDIKFDCIIHACGYGQPLKFLTRKMETLYINTFHTVKLIEMMKPDGIFLFISSSEVYNGLIKNEVTEEDIGISSIDHPRAAYIEGKRLGEVICNIYREKFPNIRVARLSLSYGPGTKIGDTRVVNTLINNGLTRDTIELLDDGTASRTFCYISDAVEMLWNVALNSKDFIYNVGGIYTCSILDLAETIGQCLNKPIVLPEVDRGLEGSPKNVRLSIDKYVKEFNKYDFVEIEKGVIETIKWQRHLNENEKN